MAMAGCGKPAMAGKWCAIAWWLAKISCRAPTGGTSLLQRWLLGTHQGAVAHSHLDYYLDGFVVRFYRRRSRSCGLLFYRLIEQSLTVAPVRCPQFIGGTRPQGIVLGEQC